MKKVVIFILSVTITLSLFAQDNFIKNNYTKREYRIPMRDGVKLFISVYSPKDTSVKYPILLLRTPYSCSPYGEDKYKDHIGPSRYLEKEKYIFVWEDVRGKFMSEGKYINMRPWERGAKGKIDETTDTYDTIDWLIKNVKGNNGKVGMWGISYPGFYSAMGAMSNHPALKAVSPQAPISDWFIDDDMHHHGALSLAMTFDFFSVFGIPHDSLTTHWTPRAIKNTPDQYNFFLKLGALANINKKYFHHGIPFWDSVAAHGTYDYFWKKKSTLDDFTDVKPAVMTVGGWYDSEDLFGAIHTYKEIEKKNKSTFNIFVMGPWYHGGWSRGTGEKLGDVEFGSSTSDFYQKNIELPFFNFYLKNKGQMTLPEAYVFETGRNRWRKFDNWPPKRLREKSLYLSDANKLSFDFPEHADSVEYISDPNHPVPYTAEIIDAMRFYPKPYMTEDQRFASTRPDVAVFSTDVLDSDITIAGSLTAELFVSVSTSDADFVVKLIDEYPDSMKSVNGVKYGGYQQLVRYDIMRGKFRNSYSAPEPFIKGKPTKVEIPLQDILHTFRKGHKIMVQIQSSMFPFYDRNPQVFTDIYSCKDSDFTKAKIQIYTGGTFPSLLKIKTE